MWQGHFTLKNDNAAVQLHFLSGNMELAKKSLPFPTPDKPTPSLRIAQRMRLEATQIEGVEKRIQVSWYCKMIIWNVLQMAAEHCLLLALPCGRDPLDVHAQTRALKTSFISYLMQKQAAGIINIIGAQVSCSCSLPCLIILCCHSNPVLFCTYSHHVHFLMVIWQGLLLICWVVHQIVVTWWSS